MGITQYLNKVIKQAHHTWVEEWKWGHRGGRGWAKELLESGMSDGTEGLRNGCG